MEPKLLYGHYRLLHCMKRVQRDPSDLICADLFNTYLYTANAAHGRPLVLDISKHWKYELEAALLSLEEKGCIQKIREDNGFPVYRITHDGRRRFQCAMVDLSRFLLTSVVVPIVVSAVTTLITLFLTHRFGG